MKQIFFLLLFTFSLSAIDAQHTNHLPGIQDSLKAAFSKIEVLEQSIAAPQGSIHPNLKLRLTFSDVQKHAYIQEITCINKKVAITEPVWHLNS